MISIGVFLVIFIVQTLIILIVLGLYASERSRRIDESPHHIYNSDSSRLGETK